MGERTIKLPDVGEGVAEAELVEWHVKQGDLVREDAILAAVMTDKATVEIPSPVDGEVVWLGAEVGDTVAVGSPIIRLKTAGDGEESSGDKAAAEIAAGEPAKEPPTPLRSQREGEKQVEPAPVAKKDGGGEGDSTVTKPASPSSLPFREREAGKNAGAGSGVPRPAGEKPVASPAVRLRAKEAGVDLRQVPGTGPAGRISHEDLDGFLSRGPQQGARATGLAPDNSVEEIKIVGLRRRIAEKMATAKSHIPHITYVEEIDVTALEELRGALNKQKKEAQPRLTILPFLMRSMVRAIAEQPGLNATFDDEAGIVRRSGGVHIGIATQTQSGLMVPVVRHAESRDIWDCAAEMGRVSEAARDGTATREELTGSTITITSLGAMGGVVTTPVINYPEVAIVGVNKMMVRPVWDGTQFIPRKMMNLSSSFDHRVIDGWDAATFVQKLKTLLETPALIFVN